jgi:PIN domain nuclease of toxin-antitoxin system
VKLLLDTHIWIWAVNRPEKLGRFVKRQLESTKNELFLSPLSVWEAHGVAMRGKLPMKGDFSEWLDRALANVPLNEATLSVAVIAEGCKLRLPQSDFVDIFLAATCIVHNLTLITADTQLIKCSWLKTLPN